jgi:hypothetical protein
MLMPGGQASRACCDRCAGLARTDATSAGLGDTVGASVPAGIADPRAATAAATMAARRRLLKAAVFRSQAGLTGDHHAGGADHPVDTRRRWPGPRAETRSFSRWLSGQDAPQSRRSALAGPDRTSFADVSQAPRAVSGTILDVSPHVLVLGAAGSEQRFTLTADATAWRGAPLEPAALRQGDNAVVRLHPGSRHVADRIWANIGRVTGIITERSGSRLVVDEGVTRPPQTVVIQPRVVGRILVRFPTLEPGYLVDIIGLRRRDGELDAMLPATSQPAYPAHRLPAPPLVSGHLPESFSGSATWHEPRDEPPGVLGVAYPALDPDAGCAEDAAAGGPQSYARMPYLAIGSVLSVRNDCTGQDLMVPVTGCASIGRLFNDRCVSCGTSPRGRIAELTMASFIALGGELESGCFNATVTIGG